MKSCRHWKKTERCVAFALTQRVNARIWTGIAYGKFRERLCLLWLLASLNDYASITKNSSSLRLFFVYGNVLAIIVEMKRERERTNACVCVEFLYKNTCASLHIRPLTHTNIIFDKSQDFNVYFISVCCFFSSSTYALSCTRTPYANITLYSLLCSFHFWVRFIFAYSPDTILCAFQILRFFFLRLWIPIWVKSPENDQRKKKCERMRKKCIARLDSRQRGC